MEVTRKFAPPAFKYPWTRNRYRFNSLETMATTASSETNGVAMEEKTELSVPEDDFDGWAQQDEDTWDEPVNTNDGQIKPPARQNKSLAENDPVAELKERLGHLELEIQDLNQRLKGTSEDLESKSEELKTKNQELFSRNDEYEKVTQELNEKNAELEAKKQELLSQTEALTTANLKLNEQVQQLSANEQNLKEKIEELEALRSAAEKSDAVGNDVTENVLVDDGVSPKVDKEYINKLEEELEEVRRERDDNKQQLEGFLSKISSMKTVFQNYKTTQSELEELKLEMEALQQEYGLAKEDLQSLTLANLHVESQLKEKESENSVLLKTLEELKTQSADLNSECDRLTSQLTSLRREYESKDETVQDEKYALENEVGKLTKKLNEEKHAYSELELAHEELTMEIKNFQSMVEELNQKLQQKDAEIARYVNLAQSQAQEGEAQKEHLNNIMAEQNLVVESLEKEVARLNTVVSDCEAEVERKNDQIAQLQGESAKIAALQDEIHSKLLVIGKLRHEAVILNEHLTKSMGMLKQQLVQSKNTVDRDLISNLFLNFVQLPRGDTKKFEALQLISDLLEWDDTRKVQAGLTQAGAAGKPRDEDGRPLRQGFISMWTDFLEKESSKSKSIP